MELPDVLLLTGDDRRKQEFAVYAEHTGAAVATADTSGSAADGWMSAPLVVVASDMVATVLTSALPNAEHCGDIVLLSSDTMPLAVQTGIAMGAGYIVHESVGAAWLLTMMRKAAVRGADARRALAEARTTDR
ncbi:hypothetical protein [Micromonospora aurantiaca (nom. illeg.)]|uniref:hypothetical protein n=1 Tax=Micromonospora aurantiaca (nom. illeg.) TaxID=47850 RepID=UPI0011A4CB0A|nr:hypothetical protein [Micromonospora aurantiaca]MBC9000474.1 hypothetical protein [Micromonospora aurantiaca]